MCGFALLWATLAGAITMRTAADHLPFSLTWWSFTFAVGTCVTSTTALAVHTGADLFRRDGLLRLPGRHVAAGRRAHRPRRSPLFLPAQPDSALALA
jgi:hypothetical protein